MAAAEQSLLSGLAAEEVTQLSGLIRRLSMEIHRAQPNSNPCDAMDHLP